ncbi:MAG: hypothetical protein GW761_07590 [Leptospira sp.]|nr:hypothetical protein [Leptospira sp.]
MKKQILSILLFAGITANIIAAPLAVSPDDLDGSTFTYHPFSKDCTAREPKRPKSVSVKKFKFEGQEQILFGAPNRTYDYQLYFDKIKSVYYNETKTRGLRFLSNEIGVFYEDGKDGFCFEIKRK